MSKNNKEIESLIEIDKILLELNDEDAAERIINFLLEKHIPYFIWSKRDLLRNFEYVLKKHSELMHEHKYLKCAFPNIDGIK